MNVRKRLLTSHIAVILIVMILFGFFSFQIAKHAVIDKEMEIAEEITSAKADLLTREYQKVPDIDYLSRFLNLYGNDSDLFILLDDNNNIIAPKAVVDNSEILMWLNYLKNNIYDSYGKNHTELNDLTYIWALYPVENTPYKLVYLCADIDKETYPIIKQLMARMLATGIVILWIASWVSLVMSSAISQQLNKQRQKLERQATQDFLTGLANREYLQSTVDKALKGCDSNKKLLLILMDLDHFKLINDTLGHKVGDMLLKQLSDRLKKHFQDAIVISRLGGDEFAFAFFIANNYQAMQKIDKILSIVDRPFAIDSFSLDTKGSIGAAIAPEHGNTAMSLIRRADIAMYQAKESGGGFGIYDHEKDPHSVAHLTLMTDLRHVIENDQLDLFYQPKIDMKSGKITGVEALCRWRHPEQGMIRPDIFIGLAEQIGMIKPITLWVLYVGINQCKKWHRAGIPLGISINLSANLLQDSQLPSRIADALRNEGLPAEYLTLEITETAIMKDPARAMEILKQLDAMGIQLSLDDFGTGYTSLSYLKHLPVNEIKIDKSFVMDMLRDSDDATIVLSIIQLAHSMQREIVAEGIESSEIWDALVTLGCDTAQGFYMAKPMPADELERWLKESQWGLGEEAIAKLA
ncbi:MAG: EAL domain-containing protein [Gammaproteobacteria bacterium]|nr:EAL domain-containing protein [Gammaproteobacteria bacterium]